MLCRSSSPRRPISRSPSTKKRKPELGRQPAGRGVRRIKQPGFFQIGHHVADRRRRQVLREAARQSARADRLAGGDITVNDQPEDLSAALVELVDRRKRRRSNHQSAKSGDPVARPMLPSRARSPAPLNGTSGQSDLTALAISQRWRNLGTLIHSVNVRSRAGRTDQSVFLKVASKDCPPGVVICPIRSTIPGRKANCVPSEFWNFNSPSRMTPVPCSTPPGPARSTPAVHRHR